MFSRLTSLRFATALLTIILISSVAFGASWRDLFGFFAAEPVQVTTTVNPEEAVVGASVTTNGGSGLAQQAR